MRIITGKYKGRVIKMPKGIRPTQDKARKALFDILGDIEGLSFLELFAGSGAVGIEALSQGAKEVIFVEKDRGCIEAIQANLEVLEASAAQVIGLDTLEAIRRFSQKQEKFEVIFSDPPYYLDLAKKTLQILGAYDILAPNGFIVMQHFKKDELPIEQGQLRLLKEARYGDTLLSFYEKKVVCLPAGRPKVT
ncbi:MAG: 16S rRNA (guanine(966)-N(2))-methyltransferase RsmD [Candidatus Omnitrophica bacterium]|nr:16S rRNA (guanine(966)-N(2))-methyltransferase RsmD [Candidatus Omnitrophota bacterium]